jgi:hypothetical protein
LDVEGRERDQLAFLVEGKKEREKGPTSVPNRDAKEDDEVDGGPEFRLKEDEDGDEEGDKGVDSLAGLLERASGSAPSPDRSRMREEGVKLTMKAASLHCSGTLAAILPINLFLSLIKKVKLVARPCLIFSFLATMT